MGCKAWAKCDSHRFGPREPSKSESENMAEPPEISEPSVRLCMPEPQTEFRA